MKNISTVLLINLGIFRYRPPIGTKQEKGLLFWLEDLSGSIIKGVFTEDELTIIPPTSIHHPNHPDFSPTVSTIVKRKRDGSILVTYTGMSS